MLGAPFRTDVRVWPRAGELDAMENVNDEPTVSGKLHCGRVLQGGPCNEPSGLTATYGLGKRGGRAGFHTYTVVWNTAPERVRWYVDDHRYSTVTRGMLRAGAWRSTFSHGFFILLNVAIGGTWPGPPSTSTRSGAPMLVDYVTVARSRDGAAGPPVR